MSFLTDFIKRLQSTEPNYDWKPKVSEPQYPDRRLKVCAAPELPEPSTTLEIARREMYRAMAEYTEEEFPEHMLLVRALPGTGKTQGAARLVDELVDAGHRVAYAGPRHDFFEDVIAKAEDPSRWYEWMPRQMGDEEKIETCRYTNQINKWMVRGWEPMDFCSGVCGWDYVRQCPFHQQKERREPVIFIQHQHVTLGHPMEFSILIGDENPVSAFLKNWEIPQRWVLPPGMDHKEPATEILKMLADICENTPRATSGPELIEGLGGCDSVIEAFEKYEIPIDGIGYEEIHVPEDADKKPYFHLPVTASLLLREAKAIKENGDCVHRVIASSGSLNLLIRRSVSDKLPKHVIWLDATGRVDVYEQLFQRPVRVFDARPKMHGKIYQVVDRANGKSNIKPSKGVREQLKKTDDWEPDHAKHARKLIERIISNNGYQNPSIISFMGFDAPHGRTGHFYGQRGTNEHENADAVIVLGTPQPPIFEVVKMAKMIYFDRDKPFDVSWCLRDQAYSYVDENGDGRCYPVSGFWNDLQLHSVLSAIREDEIVQSAHRGRPVNKPTDIWLLTNIPIVTLPPDELVTMREIMNAPLGVNIWKWSIVQDLIDKGEPFGVIELVEAGVSRKTASEYINLCEPPPGWRRGFLPPKGGRPGKGLLPLDKD